MDLYGDLQIVSSGLNVSLYVNIQVAPLPLQQTTSLSLSLSLQKTDGIA